MIISTKDRPALKEAIRSQSKANCLLVRKLRFVGKCRMQRIFCFGNWPLYWKLSTSCVFVLSHLIRTIKIFSVRFCYGNQFEVFCTLDHDDQSFVIAPRHESGRSRLSGRTRNYAFPTFSGRLPILIFFANGFYSGLSANPALQFCE